MTAALQRARVAFANREWRTASDAYAEAAAAATLDRDDSERRAVAGYLAGRDDECDAGWDAAHRAALDAGDPAEAARCAVLCALCLVLRGSMAQAGGWLARADALLAECAPDCAAAGYGLIPRILGALGSGDADAAVDMATRAVDIGRRAGDDDLRAFGVLGLGQALLAGGDVPAGLSRLDEVMLAVAAGEVGPVATGIIYCAVIIECLRLHDVARAAEWTRALGDWCDAQPDLVPYRGQCLVHRSQLHQASGDWPDAVAAVEAACQRLAEPPHPALGLAHYQQGELHRLIGDIGGADVAYRAASRAGHDPMPGLALLELARGDVGAAVTAIGRALQETRDALTRAPLLAAAVDIHRAANDLAAARAAADELAALVTPTSSPALRAMAAQATGTALLTEGDAASALVELRAAAKTWAALHMPYESARAAVLIGLACAALGDRTAADVELGNARATFEELGAATDLARLDALTGAPGGDDLLSRREREVLELVAAGKTNREIAEALVISQHTAGRHVEHIFVKLGVSSRAAATAYAYEHGLLTRT